MVEWLEQLDYVAESCRKVVSSRLDFTIVTIGKLFVSTQQWMSTFFKLGKAKAAKGEGQAPPVISCAEDTVGL